MVPIALVLLALDIPGLLKYPILALSTWVTRNLIVYAHKKSGLGRRQATHTGLRR